MESRWDMKPSNLLLYVVLMYLILRGTYCECSYGDGVCISPEALRGRITRWLVRVSFLDDFSSRRWSESLPQERLFKSKNTWMAYV